MMQGSLLAVAFAATLALGADESPKSVAAKRAKIDFESAMKPIRDEYQKKVAKLKGKYVKDLEAARADALKAKDLDEAQRILTEQKGLGDVGGEAAFQIVTAWVGYYDRWIDVTEGARKLVRNGELRVNTAGDVAAGKPDPAFGNHKAVVVVYMHRGVIRIAIAGSDKPLLIPGPK
jgi:hypothetical protein